MRSIAGSVARSPGDLIQTDLRVVSCMIKILKRTISLVLTASPPSRLSLNFSPRWPILKPVEFGVAEVQCIMNWKKLLESISESLNDHLRLRNDYLMAENRILRNHIDGRVQLT